jgi:hypothetical protein
VCGEEQLKSCINAKNIEHIQSVCQNTRTAVFEALDKKMPRWAFYPMFATLIGGILTVILVQVATYEKMSSWITTTESRIRIIEERQDVVRGTLRDHIDRDGDRK